MGKRKGSSFPNPPPFSIPPYPLPLSTPATQAKLYINGRSMIPPVFFFTVLPMLSLPQQGFPVTCGIGHCCVCSPLLFASDILCDSPTVNRGRIQLAQSPVTKKVALQIFESASLLVCKSPVYVCRAPYWCTVLVHHYDRRKSTETSGVRLFYKNSFFSLEN